MKRVLIVIAVVFSLGILASSCNQHTCPAYSQTDTEELEPQG